MTYRKYMTSHQREMTISNAPSYGSFLQNGAPCPPPNASSTLYIGYIFRKYMGFREVRLVNRAPPAQPVCFVEFATTAEAFHAMESLQDMTFGQHMTSHQQEMTISNAPKLWGLLQLPCPPPNVSSTLYIGGIPNDCTTREVAYIFRQCMGFCEVRLMYRAPPRQPVCFVDFATTTEAFHAMESLQGMTYGQHMTSHHQEMTISNAPPSYGSFLQNGLPGPPPNVSSTLYIGGLPNDCMTREIAYIFRQCMGFREVRLMYRAPPRQPVCFVDFATTAEAFRAMESLQGYKFYQLDPRSPNLHLHFSHSPRVASYGGC